MVDVYRNLNGPMSHRRRSYFFVSVFVLEDRIGEWWEDLKTDGSTRMWVGQHRLQAKEFPTLEKAKAAAQKNGYKRYRIWYIQPPTPPERTWPQECVFEQGAP